MQDVALALPWYVPGAHGVGDEAPDVAKYPGRALCCRGDQADPGQ